MSDQKNTRADGAAFVALAAVILVMSIGLALWTDIHVVARGAIAVISGIVAAAVTFITVSRRESP